MRRDKLDLLRDILAVCSKDKARKTEIVYRSNMNFLKIDGYLDWLIAHGFMRKQGPFYEITPEGLSILSRLNEIIGKWEEESTPP
jgi:predicted transcriptional regulator